MKNSILRLCVIVCFFLSSFTAFSQDPSNTSQDTPIEDDDTPIDNGVIWLGVAGLSFGLYYYSTQRKKIN